MHCIALHCIALSPTGAKPNIGASSPAGAKPNIEFKNILNRNNMEQELNLKEELLKNIKAHIKSSKDALKKGEDPGEKRKSAWIHEKKTRDRMFHTALGALEDYEEGSWIAQLSMIIKEVEDKPEWESTAKKLLFGNQGKLKELRMWRKDLPTEYPYLVPVAIILGMMEEDSSLTLLKALEKETSPGISYSQYNWVKEDLLRLEGNQEQEQDQEQNQKEPPKERRDRGEGRVSRVMKNLSGAQKDGITLKANGHNLKKLSEHNLDFNGVSFSSAVTRNIYTPGNKTTEIHFFSKSRTTIFKRESEDIESKILNLLKEGKTLQDARIEITEMATLLETRKGDEKAEESEDFYKSAENAHTGKKARVWKRCNICDYSGYRWEIQEGLMQRHLQKYHGESMKTDMLDLSKGQSKETLKRKEELVKELTPVVKIQHLEQEKKRETAKKHYEALEADPQRRFKKRYVKEKAEGEA